MPIDRNGTLWDGWTDTKLYPIPKRKYATFVLYNPAPTKRRMKTELGVSVERTAVPVQFSVPAVCTRIIPQGVTNAGAKEEIRFYNHVTVATVGAGQVRNYDSEYITFDDGKLEVDLTLERDLYWYLTNCAYNANGLNPSGTPMFMEEDKKVQAAAVNKAAEEKFKAEYAVRQLMSGNNKKALVSLYGSLGYNDALDLQENDEFDILTQRLIESCQKSPARVLALLTTEDGEANILAYLAEAKERGVIQSGNGCWYWGSNFKRADNNKSKFCLVAEGVDMDEALADFMRKPENAPNFTHMKQKVDDLRAAEAKS